MTVHKAGHALTGVLGVAHTCRDAVVAVFSNGKTWQFEEWRYKKPVELFSHCEQHHQQLCRQFWMNGF